MLYPLFNFDSVHKSQVFPVKAPFKLGCIPIPAFIAGCDCQWLAFENNNQVTPPPLPARARYVDLESIKEDIQKTRGISEGKTIKQPLLAFLQG
jgi:hypothetical protein